MKRNNISYNNISGLNLSSGSKKFVKPLIPNIEEYIKGFDIETLQTYVNEGKINQKDFFGNSPIILAVWSESLEKLKYLLTIPEVNVNIQASHTGFTALHLAVNTNHESAAKIRMLKLLLDKKPNFLIKNNDEKTPLELAISNKNTWAIKIILSSLLQDYYKSEQGQDQIFKALKYFSENNINIDYTMNEYGLTPFIAAITTRKTNIIEAVIEARSDVNKSLNLNHETPLYYAIRIENIPIIKLLLKKNANVNTQIDERSTALHWAAEKNSAEIMDILLKEAPEMNLKDYKGNTALHTAVQYNSGSVLPMLIGQNANINSQNNQKETPLHKAINCDKSIITALLKARAGVNLQDISGNTPPRF